MSHPLYLTTYLHKKISKWHRWEYFGKVLCQTYAFRPEASSPQSRTTEDTDRKAMGDFCLKARVSNVCFRTHTIHLSVSETRGVFSFGRTPGPVNQMLASGLVTWGTFGETPTDELLLPSDIPQRDNFDVTNLERLVFVFRTMLGSRPRTLNASFHWTKTIEQEYFQFDFKLRSLVTS